MRRDQRDPAAIGETLLSHASAPDRNVALSEIADHLLPRILFPMTRGDESPVERYGDPRLYDVRVTTTIERTPIAKLAAGPTDRKPAKPDGGRTFA
jgi:hypothetical protein